MIHKPIVRYSNDYAGHIRDKGRSMQTEIYTGSVQSLTYVQFPRHSGIPLISKDYTLCNSRSNSLSRTYSPLQVVINAPNHQVPRLVIHLQ